MDRHSMINPYNIAGPYKTDSTLPIWSNKLLQLMVLAGLVVFIGYNWLLFTQNNNPAPVGEHIAARPAVQVKDIQKVAQPIKSASVRVYAKKGKAALKLPAQINDDPLQMVLESTRVKADDHAQTITTVINTDTGETQTLVRREPLPWIAWDDHGEVSIAAGIKNADPTVRLQVRQGVFQVKGIHFGGVASVDQPVSGVQGTDYFVGATAYYQW